MKAFFVLLVSFGLATALTTTDYDTVRSLLVATMKSNQISSLSANLVRLCKYAPVFTSSFTTTRF